MSISRSLIATLVLSLMVLHIAEAAHAHQMIESSSGPKRDLLQAIDCKASCTARCSLSSRPNLCHRACGTCCTRCGCVPRGTSGNQELCPCYYTQTTHGGQRKCP